MTAVRGEEAPRWVPVCPLFRLPVSSVRWYVYVTHLDSWGLGGQRAPGLHRPPHKHSRLHWGERRMDRLISVMQCGSRKEMFYVWHDALLRSQVLANVKRERIFLILPLYLSRTKLWQCLSFIHAHTLPCRVLNCSVEVGVLLKDTTAHS